MQDYPIGIKGQAWGAKEKQMWLDAQTIKRSYKDEVTSAFTSLEDAFTLHEYGNLPINPQKYPLYGFSSATWDNANPTILITGGVHGYETSGVQGALRFLKRDIADYTCQFNFIVAPCISPWGYETINRWNPAAIDPNRAFYLDSPSDEARQVMNFVNGVLKSKHAENDLLMHIDLHETTDTDNSEFRPALAARDGIDMPIWEIPDGFYTVADTQSPQIDFQKSIIQSVAKVTHIAPSDENGKIIGADTIYNGVICYDKKSLFLCGGFTSAEYVSTTEVYPDSPQATPENCIDAQVAAIRGALDYLLHA